MSDCMAIKEGTPVIPGSFESKDLLIAELRKLFYSLNVANVLSGWTAVTQMTEVGKQLADEDAAAMYLLVLEPEKFQINIQLFKK